MDKLEEDPRVRSVSWHAGYLRYDCPETGCGIVVVPNSENDKAYCEKVADDALAFKGKQYLLRIVVIIQALKHLNGIHIFFHRY